MPQTLQATAPGTDTQKLNFKNALAELPCLTELKNQIKLSESVTIDERCLCDLEMILSAAFAPLDGFLCLEDYKCCLESMRLKSGKVWAIPIILPVKMNQCSVDENQRPDKSSCLLIRDITGKVVAELVVESVFRPDLQHEQRKVLGTTSDKHPYVHFMNENLQDVLYVGGKINIKNEGVIHYDYPQYRLNAKTTREMLKSKGCDKVVAFQTRNPMHRAHMELTIEALRDAMKDEDCKKVPHLLITPAVGPTQPGDIKMSTRVKCYEQILPYYTKLYSKEFPGLKTPDVVLMPVSMRMGGPREAVWHAQIRANYGCTHFVVGRDHAGPSAKNDQGQPFYGPYEAHDLLHSVEKEIGIKVCYAKMFAFCGEQLGFLPVDKIPAGVKAFNVSGTEQREILERGDDLPTYFTFPEVSRELRSIHRPAHETGLVVYLTGLPCSGKSSVADALQAKLEVEDRRAVTLLDGDVVRTNLCKGLGFDKESRSANVQRIGFVAGLVAKSGGVALCANIAPFECDRKANREFITRQGGNYVEVFVDTPLEVCEKRDIKGLYAKARAGIIPQFTGVSDPYERPQNSEITLAGDLNVVECVEKIHEYLKTNKYCI